MRTVDVVRSLRDGACVPVSALAARFDVSVRTVRAHIHEANNALAGIAAIRFSRSGNGYHLDVADAPALDAWLERGMRIAVGGERSASDERVAYLLNDLLSRPDWVTIADLAAVLYVSPQSISHDLKQVEAELAPFGLTLAKRPRYGVRVEGPEMGRRLCLVNLVSRTLIEDGSPASSDEGIAQTVAAVSEAIEAIVRDAGFSISALSFQNLVIHIVVALSRIREQALVPLSAEHLAAIRVAPEYPLAERIARAVGAYAGLTIPESEVAYIAIHLAGKKSLAALAEAGAEADGQSSVISEAIWELVDDMLARIRESFRFDFRDDLELHMNLARHLVPLTARLTYRLRVENPLLSDIKSRFPLAYAMAVEASSVLAEAYDAVVSEEEIGYLALTIALALDRQKAEAPKKNVLVVCASGVGTTRLLKQSVLHRFGDRIGTVRVCDALHVGEQDFSAIDYVFTTVPLDAPLPVPVQRINVFLDEGDVASISALIDGTPQAPAFTERLFSERLFTAHLDVADREAALTALAERAIAAGAADARLTGLVLERERTASTAFGNGIALPHPIRPITEETRVCVGLLDHPISWGDKRVRLIMLVAIGSDDHDALDFFFSGAAHLLSDESRVARILSERTFDAFVEVFASAAHDGPC